MRVFVSEYVSGGGWPAGTIAGSLAVEGRAMLWAIVEDFSRIAGVRVETTWDARLGPPPFSSARVLSVESPADEGRHFERLAGECDATLVIAPEFNGILQDRCRIVEQMGGRLLGPASRAVALCSDKLRLATHLHEAGIATIPSAALDWERCLPGSPGDGSPRFPAVIKPRDGAGSQNTWLVNDTADFHQWRRDRLSAEDRQSYIWQPYVAGDAVSVAAVFAPSGREVQVFIPAVQRLSNDGRFRYLGGHVPLRCSDSAAIQGTALTACRTVPGIRGYVGVDLILPDAAPHEPVVVEINPRLTTSYLGYRALAESNLAEWMLLPGRFERGIHWRDDIVEFDASGRIAAIAAPFPRFNSDSSQPAP